jgi:hypothetical protein
MEELGLDEVTAQKVVERCAAEAKIVAVEQEAKKIADASAKAKEAAAVAADKAALLALGDSPADSAAEGKLPGAMEAVPGAAAEVVVHQESALSKGEDLSVEEQAIGGLPETSSSEAKAKPLDEEENGTAALAEGLDAPPADDAGKL